MMTDPKTSRSSALPPAHLAGEAQERVHALMRIALRAARVGGWELDLATGRSRLTEEACEIHDLPPGSQLELDQAINFYAPEHRGIIRQAVELCIREGIAFDEELRFVTAKGQKLWVRSIGEAYRGADGSILYIRGAIQDITDRKAAENGWAANRKHYRQFADEMPFIMWTADPDGNVDYANRYLFEYTGIGLKQALESRWQATVHSDDITRSLEQWQHCVATGEKYENELRVRRGSDGVYRWFHVQAVLAYDCNGKRIKWYGSGIDVHHTKKVERKASKLAKRLQNTLQSITDAVFIMDRNWRIIFVNSAATRLLERSSSELLGNNVWEEFPEAVGTVFYHAYHRALAEGKTVCVTDFYPPLNRWFEVRAYPSRDGLAIYFLDVTQRRKNEEHLRLLDTCIAGIDESIMITEAAPLDEPGPRIVFINDAFTRRTGYSRDEVIGRSPRFLQGRETQRDALDRIRLALSEGQTAHEELINYTKAGRTFYNEINIVPVADDTSRLTHFVAIERDVTQRRRAEERLRESEERFRFLSQATTDAIWDWDLITNRVWRSAGYGYLSGSPNEEARGHISDWIRLIHPDDRERVLLSVNRIIDEGGSCWIAEYRLIRNDGSELYVLDRGSVIRNEQGKPIRMIGGILDQTAKRNAENEVRRLNNDLENRVAQRTAELEAANKELEAFSYSVSHDLLAPLRSIDSFSLIALEDYADKLDDEGHRLLNIIRGEAQRMAQLIRDLLEFSRTGRQLIQRVPCNLTQLAQAAFDLIPPEDRGHIKAFELHSLPRADGDPNMLRQVWINLIANAVKFSRHRPDAKIEIGGWADGDLATYFVKDNGTGFDPRYKHKLFKVFQRLHSEEEFEGTGVGLAIVQRIIRRHGGEVWAEAQPDVGTTVFFTLPLPKGSAT